MIFSIYFRIEKVTERPNKRSALNKMLVVSDFDNCKKLPQHMKLTNLFEFQKIEKIFLANTLKLMIIKKMD